MCQPFSLQDISAETVMETDLVVEGGELPAHPNSDSGITLPQWPKVLKVVPSEVCQFPDLLPLATLFAGKKVHVVYFFSGVQRKGDVKTFLQMFCGAINTGIEMHEVDLLQGPSHDLSIQESQDEWIQRMGSFNIVLCTPPCSDFSRVKWANRFGPPPRAISKVSCRFSMALGSG